MTKLKTYTIPISQLTLDHRKQLYELFIEYYDDVCKDIFFKDLDKKDKIILLSKKDSKEIVGFSTIKIMCMHVGNKKTYVLFSGDTVVKEIFWGQTALNIEFAKNFFQLKLQHPKSDVCWFLISKGYKTYLLLAKNFYNFYPRYNKKTPQKAKELIENIAMQIYPDYFDKKNQVIKNVANFNRLKDQVAPIGSQELTSPHVKFFVSANPNWKSGDELCCIGYFDMPFVCKYISRTFKKVLFRKIHNLNKKKKPKKLKGFHLFKHLLAMKNNYTKSYYHLFQEYGDIVRLDKPWKMAIISDADLAKKILIDDSKMFTISKLAHELKPLMGEGMITSDDKHWMNQKRLVSKSFSLKSIQLFSTDIESLAKKQISELEGEVNLSQIILSYTYDIINQLIFGDTLPNDHHKLEFAIRYCLNFISKRQASLLKLPLFFYPKFTRQIKIIENVLLLHSKDSLPNSLMETFCMNYDLKSSDGAKKLRDQVVTLFITGHETTANTLTWCLYHILSQKLPIEKILHDEQYLEAIIKETMRLYPAAPVSPRSLKEDYQYKNYNFRKAEEILVSSFNLHRHPKYWEKPDEFNPSNFYKKHVDANYYFPFGRGKRACIGEHLAMTQMKTFIVCLFETYHVTTKNEDLVICDFDATLTLRPKEDLLVNLQKNIK